MDPSIVAVGTGALFIGLGVGFLMGARKGEAVARAEQQRQQAAAKKQQQQPVENAPYDDDDDDDDDDDESVAAVVKEPKINPFEELKMTFVCSKKTGPSSFPDGCCLMMRVVCMCT